MTDEKLKQNVVLIPVKPPVPGQVKTRLGSVMSLDECARLSFAMLLDLLDALSENDAYDVVLISECHNQDSLERLQLPAQVMFFDSVEGHRSLLLRQAFTHFLEKSHRVVCVFADVPYVFAQVVTQAFRLLEDHQVVIGEDSGSGYYLLGLSRFVDLFSPFASVIRRPYLEETKQICRDLGLSVSYVPAFPDLDTLDDIRKIQWSIANPGWSRTYSILFNLNLINPNSEH